MLEIIELKAPVPRRATAIFLAGSIEQGKAEQWQKSVVEELRKWVDGLHENDPNIEAVYIYNPRREDWDATLEQSRDNPVFRGQVDWEMNMIDVSNLVAFYFDKNTISPITLLELGYCAGKKTNALVYCPDGYFRKGNVDIVADRARFTEVNSFREFVNEIKAFIKLKAGLDV